MALTMTMMDGVASAFKTMEPQDDFFAMYIHPRQYVDLKLAGMSFGMWPLSAIRRSAVRKYMIDQLNKAAEQEEA